VAAKAKSAVVFRMPCEPMNAIFAGRGQPSCGEGGGVLRRLVN